MIQYSFDDETFPNILVQKPVQIGDNTIFPVIDRMMVKSHLFESLLKHIPYKNVIRELLFDMYIGTKGPYSEIYALEAEFFYESHHDNDGIDLVANLKLNDVVISELRIQLERDRFYVTTTQF